MHSGDLWDLFSPVRSLGRKFNQTCFSLPFLYLCVLFYVPDSLTLSLSFRLSLFLRRSPEGVDGQPPALPPKQLSRKTLSQIIQAHSQQSLLDNHLNEMYDVPVNADKTTVSVRTKDTIRITSRIYTSFHSLKKSIDSLYTAISSGTCLGFSMKI